MRAIVEKMIENYRKEILDLRIKMYNHRCSNTYYSFKNRLEWVKAKKEAAEDILAEIDKMERQEVDVDEAM